MWITPFFDNMSTQFCYNASHAEVLGIDRGASILRAVAASILVR